MWAIAVYDLGLSTEQFLELTPVMFSALLERYQGEQQYNDFRAGTIVSTIANICRDKKTPAYTPAFFFPSLKEAEKNASRKQKMSADQIKLLLQTYYPPGRSN